jgi:hypothetical protein
MALLKYESQVRPPLVDGSKGLPPGNRRHLSSGGSQAIDSMVDWIYCFCVVHCCIWRLFRVWTSRSLVRYGPVEPEQNNRMGMGYHQLRMVGRYRSRRNPYLCYPVTLSSGMENRCKPCGRSDDHLRGNVRRPVPNLPHGSCMECLLYVLPYPNTRGPLWVNFNSPLLWDVFAISTYFTVSLLFWYSGLLPDLATLRDRAKEKWRKHVLWCSCFRMDRLCQTLAKRHEALSLVLAGLE